MVKYSQKLQVFFFPRFTYILFMLFGVNVDEYSIHQHHLGICIKDDSSAFSPITEYAYIFVWSIWDSVEEPPRLGFLDGGEVMSVAAQTIAELPEKTRRVLVVTWQFVLVVTRMVILFTMIYRLVNKPLAIENGHL